MLVCMGVGRIFSRGATSGFFQKFSRGTKSGEICFLPLETKKTLFWWKFQIPAPFRHPCLCVGKSSCHTIKSWWNYKRFNTILNSGILLNVIRKMKYLTYQLLLRFCFCIGNTKYSSYILFLHWQHKWHPYRELASWCILFFLVLHSGI